MQYTSQCLQCQQSSTFWRRFICTKNISYSWCQLARSRGGGIYAQKIIGTGLVSDNIAQLDGGGIYSDSNNLSFNGNITIRNNSAQLGGGVYSDNNTFTIDGDNVFERNFATYYGGGIYIRRSPLILARNIFLANSAGGGIYVTTKKYT